MADVYIKNSDESEMDTILSEDIDFTGNMKFQKPLMIKGKFSGDIKSSGGLYIDKNAEVKAEIEADRVSVKGVVRGNINAASSVELYSTANVKGDITSPILVMEGGCKFNGVSVMKEDPQKNENA